MNLLLDTCIWGGAKDELQAAAHDVLWITLDKDFGELAIRRSLPHCGIVRLVNISARQQGAVCQRLLAQYGVN